MVTTNDDWDTLCAIYDDGEEGSDQFDESQDNNSQRNDERKLKLVASSLPNGFCGTVYMTLSTSKIAFARLVRSDGSYRYFTLTKPPILKLDLLYCNTKSASSLPNDDDDSSESESERPSTLRLIWHYYPSEWPTCDKEKYRSSLAKKCYSILREEGSFSVCQFLEHDAISFYYEDRSVDETIPSDETEYEPTINTSNSWKTYDDPNYPDYLLVILPPNMDQLYYSSPGVLLHPQEEATRLKRIAAEEKLAVKKLEEKKEKKLAPKPPTITITAKKKKHKADSKALITHIDSTLDFGRHALLQNWKVRDFDEFPTSYYMRLGISLQ